MPSGNRNITVGDIVKRTRVALTLDQGTAKPRLSWGAVVSFDRQDFQSEASDEETFRVGVRFNYRWRPCTTFALNYDFTRSRRTDVTPQASEEDIEIGLRMNRTINPRLRAAIYASRRSAESGFRGGEYGESITGLRVDYQI